MSDAPDIVRYSRPDLLLLSRSPKVVQAGTLQLSPPSDEPAGGPGVTMPRFKEWFGDLPPPSPPQARPSPHSPPTSRARPVRQQQSSDGPAPRERERDRPPHHSVGGSSAVDKAGISGGMGSFRHASSRGERRGDRAERERKEDGEDKGGLRKMAESFDRGERVPKSWGARATDSPRDDREGEKESQKDDSNWGKGDWRSRAANLPSKPSLSTTGSNSSTAATPSNREGGRTAPGRPAWNPAPSSSSLNDRERGDRRDRRRNDQNDDDETPAWMRAESPGDALEKGGSRKGRPRADDKDGGLLSDMGGGGRKKESAPASDLRDGEDAIMRFKREMRERDGTGPPPQESQASSATPAPDKPVSSGMFDHLSPRMQPSPVAAPLLPSSNTPTNLFRDPAILSSPSIQPASPVVSSATGQKRAPGGSRFAKFFQEDQKKPTAAPVAPLAPPMASPPVQHGQPGNLMNILAGGGGGGAPGRSGEENNQMNKLLAMLQSSHAPEPNHTRSQMPPPHAQSPVDLASLSLGGQPPRPPAGLPAQFQQPPQRNSRPSSPAFLQQQQQQQQQQLHSGGGRSPMYPPGGDRYDQEPARRQDRDHLQVLLDAQAQQQRSAAATPPNNLGGGGGYSVDQLRQLQQMGGGGPGPRMGPPPPQNQQAVFRQQSISPPPLGLGSGGLPPPNAAEIQNQLLRQMMMNGGGGGGPGPQVNGRGGPPGGQQGYPMGPPPPQQGGRPERYLDQLLAQHQGPPPPHQAMKQQPPYIDPSQLPHPRQQYIESLRQQQQQPGGYPGMGGPQQGQVPYGGGGFGVAQAGAMGQQDLMALLRTGNSGLGRP